MTHVLCQGGESRREKSSSSSITHCHGDLILCHNISALTCWSSSTGNKSYALHLHAPGLGCSATFKLRCRGVRSGLTSLGKWWFRPAGAFTETYSCELTRHIKFNNLAMQLVCWDFKSEILHSHLEKPPKVFTDSFSTADCLKPINVLCVERDGSYKKRFSYKWPLKAIFKNHRRPAG